MLTDEDMEPKGHPAVSVIIRTKNEERYLGKVLEALSRQTFDDFETILVDDRSKDDTLDIAAKYGCRIVTVPDGKFSHPYSCNLGAESARGTFLIYTNGHSIPASDTFIEDGLENFQDPSVAGVFALPVAHEDGTIADRIIYDIAAYTVGAVRYRAGDLWYAIIGTRSGLLGTTNAMIRKDLWNEYRFDEKFNGGWGGEDADWAWHFVKKGYKIIHDPRFRVQHSHHLRLRDTFWQFRNWHRMITAEETPERQRKYF